MDANQIQQELNGQWAAVINDLCEVDPAILDGKHHPCPFCGGKDRFNLDRDGSGAIYCNNKCKVRDDGEKRPELTTNGIGTVAMFNGWSYKKAIDEVSKWIDGQQKITDEMVDFRDSVNSRLSKAFGISEENLSSLKKRGLSESEIKNRGYWSIVESPARNIMWEFSDSAERKKIGQSLPGIMPNGSLSINASDCLVIPMRNIDGKIVESQYRPNRDTGGGKYQFLSSKKNGGVPARSICHFALPKDGHPRDFKTVRITEGPLKADIATALSGVQTLAIAGVGSWRVAVEAILSTKAELALIAFDADFRTNQAVANAVVETFDSLQSAGIAAKLEIWDSEHKGIDDALAVGAPTQILTDEETKSEIDKIRKDSGKKQKADRLKNYKLVKSDSDDPNKAWEKQPLLINQVAESLLDLTGGWPKNCGGQLFVQTKDGQIRWFNDTSQLFGWISTISPVEFHCGNGCINKKEFFSELPFFVDEFKETSELPHFPPIKKTYYAKKYSPGNGDYLEKFLNFFSPATEYDRELILAFVATTFWGGSPGRRVCFGIDSIVGTGVGKSELVKRVSSISGGFYDFDSRDVKDESVKRSFLNGKKFRIALMDNVKDSCLSISVIESLITQSHISGHRLHFGTADRPNLITWAITMNGISLSRDLAERTVIIKLDEPGRSGSWDEEMDSLIENHRDEIISDIARFFQRPERKLSSYTRWASWEKSILSRLKNPELLKKIIKERAGDSDEDKSVAESIREYFEEKLSGYGLDPDEEVIHIPSDTIKDWIINASGKEFNKRSSSAYLKQLVDGGSIRFISPNKSRKHGRGWLWNKNGKTFEEISYELITKIEMEKREEEDRRRRGY